MKPLSGIMGEAWKIYRTYAQHLLTIAFAVYVVASLLEAVLVGLLGLFGSLLAIVVGLIAGFLVQAALVKAVEDVRDGRVDMSLGDTLRAARPAVGRVAGASILEGIAIVIGLVLLVVPGLYLLTIWFLVVPVLVLEGVGVGASFSRSRELVRGFGWNVFGTLIIVFLLLIAVDLVIEIVLTPLPQPVSQGLGGVVSGTLVAPFWALIVTLGYFRLRAAHETVPGPR
jgi:hypothetical protein